MKLRLLTLALLMLAPYAAGADSGLGFLYSRSDIAITRNKPSKLPWQKDIQPTVKFDVEIRDATGAYNRGQTGWYNLSSLEEHNGIMMVFKEPVSLPITRSMEYAPLDVLLIDREGKIIEILPSLKLSTLDHDIVPDKPVLAFLFLQGGISEKLSINPGDQIDSDVFKKSELIINKDKARTAPTDVVSTPPLPLIVPDTPQVIQR